MSDGRQMEHPNLIVSQIYTNSYLTQLLTAASKFLTPPERISEV